MGYGARHTQGSARPTRFLRKPEPIEPLLKPMRILMFNYEYPPLGGGGGVVHELLAEELATRHEVTVVTSAVRGLPRHEERGGVTIHRVPIVGRRDLNAATLVSLLSYPPSAILFAQRLLRRRTFDLINGHFAVPTAPASVHIAKRAGIPHVLTIQGGDIYDPSKRLSPHRIPGVRSVVTSVLNQSDAVVAASRNVRDNAHRLYRFSGQVELIPLGIRQPTYVPAARAHLGLPASAFLGVTVGRLVKRKAIDQLIHILNAPQCREVHLAVIGDGPELSRLRLLARDLGVDDRVHFLGRVSEQEKWQVLESADVYLSTTMHEGFGLVYLEAMAAGLPVITYDHGGQIDFLTNGESGYLVPAGTATEFRDVVVRAMTNPGAMAKMGERNRGAAPNHRIDACAASYESLFTDLVRRANAHTS